MFLDVDPCTAPGIPNGTRSEVCERVTRILVVGEPRVGKTLLLRRLCDHIFGDTTLETEPREQSGLGDRTRVSGSVEDEEDLGPEWGPTVGLAIYAVKRDTTIPISETGVFDRRASRTREQLSAIEPLVAMGDDGAFSSTPSLYGCRSVTTEYESGGRATSGGNTSGTLLRRRGQNVASVLNAPFAATTSLRRQQVLQTIEFHELGGTHGYRDTARLPLQHIHYDGVMFVYHRGSLSGTMYLKEWYRWVQSVLRTSRTLREDFSSGPARSRQTAGKMPRFILVGTHLPGDEMYAGHVRLSSAGPAAPPSAAELIPDEALAHENVEVKLRTLQSKQMCQRLGWACQLLYITRFLCSFPYRVLWCVQHPFFFLSEQYHEERGPRNRVAALLTRFTECLLWRLYQVEQALLYVMAVVLFGPYQESAVLSHSRAKAIVEELRRDEQCVAQAHVCRLDSNVALQSSVDELTSFFDLLLWEASSGDGVPIAS